MFRSSNFRHWIALGIIAFSSCSCIESEYPLISVGDRTNIGNVIYETDLGGAAKPFLSNVGGTLYKFLDTKNYPQGLLSFRYIKTSGATDYFLMQLRVDSTDKSHRHISVLAPVRIDEGNRPVLGDFRCDNNDVLKSLVDNHVGFDCSDKSPDRMINNLVNMEDWDCFLDDIFKSESLFPDVPPLVTSAGWRIPKYISGYKLERSTSGVLCNHAAPNTTVSSKYNAEQVADQLRQKDVAQPPSPSPSVDTTADRFIALGEEHARTLAPPPAAVEDYSQGTNEWFKSVGSPPPIPPGMGHIPPGGIPGYAGDGVPAAIAEVVTPTKDGYEFYLSCKPKPLPSDHADRDSVTKIFIAWKEHVTTKIFDFAVLHKHYSGRVSNRADQYTHFEHEIKQSNSTNWDFWYWIWKGQNIRVRDSYMLGGIELGMRGGETAWRYREYARKFSSPNYEELVTETDWDCTREEAPPHDGSTGEVNPPIILGKSTEIDPDKWVIAKNLSTNKCAVLATQPSDKNLVTITSFKNYVTSKAVQDAVFKQCGCEKGCDFELPR